MKQNAGVRFHLRQARAPVNVLRVADDGDLVVRGRQASLSLSLGKLSLAEKADIAAEVCSRRSEVQAAVAAFYHLAAGDQNEGDQWLQAAGDKAAVVEKYLR
jgi:hypothetical protein